HAETQAVIKGIEDLVKKAGQTKLPVPENTVLEAFVKVFEKSYKAEVAALITTRVNKEGGGNETEDLITKVFDDLKMADPSAEVDKKILAAALEYVMFK